MTLTGIKTLPLLDRSLVETGPWSALFARAGYRVYPYQLGAIARALATATPVLTTGLGEFAANDYVLVCASTAYGDVNLYIPNLSKITRISSFGANLTSDPTLASDDLINVAPNVSIASGDYLFNLGADGAAAPTSVPAYDGSTLTLYTDNAGTAASANKYVLTGTNGEFRCWLPTGTLMVDLLVTNASGTPIVAIPFVTLGAEVI